MYKKSVILLIFFFLHNALIGMKRATPDQIQQLSTPPEPFFPSEITKIITSFMKTEQWWYLDKKFYHDQRVNSVCFDPSGKLLATGSCDKKARIFDIHTQEQVNFFDHDKSVRSACFDSFGKQFATISDNAKIRIFDIQKTPKEIFSFSHNYVVRSACFDPSGTLFKTISSFGELCTFNISTQAKIISSFQYGTSIISACFDQSSRFLATVSHDHKTDIFDTQTQKNINFIWGHSINFDHTGKLLATISDKTARIFEIETDTEETYFFQHSDSVNSACFHPSEKLFATAWNNTVGIFARYDDYTADQLLLKKALITWLLIEKPDKKIDILEKLIADVSLKCTISEEELCKTWKTFPKNMCIAIWMTMLYRIQTYGKEVTTIEKKG